MKQINDLKADIEKEFFEETMRGTYLGEKADKGKLKPMCTLLGLRLNNEDPIETCRDVFTKVKKSISTLIDLDEEEDPKLKLKISDDELFEPPYLEVLKDVRSRILMLFEIEPSVNYITNVTRIGRGGRAG